MTTPGVSTAADFKKQNPEGIDFTLPSGLTCLVKRPGITEMIAEGLFPDSLVGLVSQFVDTGQGKKPQDRRPSKAQQQQASERMQQKAMAEITSDPVKMKEMFKLIDVATVYCVLEPVVHTNRYPEGHELAGQIIPPAERDNEWLYVDNIQEDDRMAIFNFAIGGEGEGNDEGVESFREEA